jgi:hypothetical protein
MWWHQQKSSRDNPLFIRHEMFPGVPVARDKKNYLLSEEDKKLLDLVNKSRADKDLRPVRATPELCKLARQHTGTNGAFSPGKDMTGEVTLAPQNIVVTPESLFKLFPPGERWHKDAQEAGISFFRGSQGRTGATIIFRKGTRAPRNAIVVWDGMKKQFISQTHALHLVDLNGDGVKDMVTGRRWWAHQARGDAAPTEPAFLFWFEGRRGKDGMITFAPHLIDDDSGIGTQFTVADINGDGLLDIIISNKKGVFVFEQVREATVSEAPARKD